QSVVSVSVNNDFSSASAASVVNIIGDSLPTVVSVIRGCIDHSRVTVTFNEPVDAASAQVLTHYTISNGIVVTGATLNPDGKTVTLSTDSIEAQGCRAYQLTVIGVKDLSGHNFVIATVPITLLEPRTAN